MGRGSEQTFFQRRQTDGQQAHEIKDVWHHELLGKCKLKLQWDITSYLLEWLS